MTDIIGAKPAPAANLIKDATIETFQADVLKASLEVPVIVDFWAAWCAPCRQLGPMLEKQVIARGGKVRMVKVDTDKNQMLAQQLRIQSLPTVMAFVGGQPVDGFVGALPESEISAFIDRTLDVARQMGLSNAAAGAADPAAMVKAGDDALLARDLTGAVSAFSAALEVAEEDSDVFANALAGLAKTFLMAGERDKAEQLLADIPAAKTGLAAVAQVKAMLALGTGGGTKSPATDATPTTAEGYFDLASAQIDAGAMENAIEALLHSIEHDREWNDGAAKTKLLTVFDALGGAHAAVKQGRRRLSAILFS